MAYCWPKMAKIDQHFFDQKRHFLPNFVNKREENTKHLEIFHIWVQKYQKMGNVGPKIDNFDF